MTFPTPDTPTLELRTGRLRRGAARSVGGLGRGPVPASWLIPGVALLLVLAGNQRLFAVLAEGRGAGGTGVVLAVGMLLWAVLTALLQPFALPRVFKPVVIALLAVTAVTAHFMSAFGVLVDERMIRNVSQTDAAEVRELLTLSLFVRLGLVVLLPGVLLALLPVRYGPLRRELLRRGLIVVVLVIAALIAVKFAYKDLSLTVRTRPEVKQMTNPLTPLAASVAWWREHARVPDGPPRPIAQDAVRGPPAAAGASTRRKIVVFVLGETATAGHFSLNGYERDTNPELAATDAVTFLQVHSCGTSTAESLPCMFSAVPQSGYSEALAAGQENVLDVLQRVGVGVLWRENNSGCKGVCARVPFESVRTGMTGLPGEQEVYDEALLDGLEGILDAQDGDMLLVLHQRGSHGPAYSQRTPPDFKRFVPECEQQDLQACSRDELVNAYDNTILYTDHVLAELIGRLHAYSKEADVAMLYVSDHGESLGENGLYLHGLPAWLAPDEQTHVPMIFWASPGFYTAERIDRQRLDAVRGAPYSHDNLFHTLLGMFDVRTALYDPGLDVFAPCRTP